MKFDILNIENKISNIISGRLILEIDFSEKRPKFFIKATNNFIYS